MFQVYFEYSNVIKYDYSEENCLFYEVALICH